MMSLTHFLCVSPRPPRLCVRKKRKAIRGNLEIVGKGSKQKNREASSMDWRSDRSSLFGKRYNAEARRTQRNAEEKKG